MNYLVLDISTSAQIGIEDSPYLSWACKKGANTPEEAFAKAGLHAEYGMICGMSAYWVSFFHDENGEQKYNVSHGFTCAAVEPIEEEIMLNKLTTEMDKRVTGIKIVGQNSKDFIIPFLAKRYLSHGLKIPSQIYDAIHSGTIDLMRELACGGVSVMSLRSSAWLFGIDDPRSSMRVPRFYELCLNKQTEEIKRFTQTNAQVASEVFGNCVLGNLIHL